jgi:hypothetical protein
MKRAEVRVGFAGDFFPTVLLLLDVALGACGSESNTGGAAGGCGVGGAGDGVGTEVGGVGSGGAAGED